MAKKTLLELLWWAIIQLITLPYHRFFTYNTLNPILEIQTYAESGVENNSPDRARLHALLRGWRNRKKDELTFVSVAGVAITAIITASFSWPVIVDSYWLASGVWYGSLMTSVCGILIAAQQVSLLMLIGELPEDPTNTSSKSLRRHVSQILVELPKPEANGEDRMRWCISWRLIFAWQCPMMFFGYSTLLYFIGLTVIVITPLIEGRTGPPIKVAITYITLSAVSWGMFAFCSLGGYNAITLDEDSETA
jgi:hypothetical protein